jgi:hypothetical protein
VWSRTAVVLEMHGVTVDHPDGCVDCGTRCNPVPAPRLPIPLPCVPVFMQNVHVLMDAQNGSARTVVVPVERLYGMRQCMCALKVKARKDCIAVYSTACTYNTCVRKATGWVE